VQALSPPPTFCDNTVAIAIAIERLLFRLFFDVEAVVT
jgi:hypothetical protein